MLNLVNSNYLTTSQDGGFNDRKVINLEAAFASVPTGVPIDGKSKFLSYNSFAEFVHDYCQGKIENFFLTLLTLQKTYVMCTQADYALIVNLYAAELAKDFGLDPTVIVEAAKKKCMYVDGWSEADTTTAWATADAGMSLYPLDANVRVFRPTQDLPLEIMLLLYDNAKTKASIKAVLEKKLQKLLKNCCHRNARHQVATEMWLVVVQNNAACLAEIFHCTVSQVPTGLKERCLWVQDMAAGNPVWKSLMGRESLAIFPRMGRASSYDSEIARIQCALAKTQYSDPAKVQFYQDEINWLWAQSKATTVDADEVLGRMIWALQEHIHYRLDKYNPYLLPQNIVSNTGEL